jgi:hypothetical protein
MRLTWRYQITLPAGEAIMTIDPTDAERTGRPPERAPEPTLEEILRAKHPEGTFTIAEAYAGPSPFESDEEIDEFILAVREWRNESLA